METKTEVKTFRIDYKCPNCETGHLRHSSRVLTTHPPQYPHECNNPECDYTETFTNKSYPYIITEDVKKRKPATKKK
jgi:hypothetical protein